MKNDLKFLVESFYGDIPQEVGNVGPDRGPAVDLRRMCLEVRVGPRRTE